jgi:lipopolysaccharide export system protein LptA
MGKQTVTALGTLVALAVAFLGYEQTLGRLTDFEPIDEALLQPMPFNDEPETPVRPEYEIAAERAFGRDEARKLARLKMYQVPKSVFSNAPPGRGLGLYIFFGQYFLDVKVDNVVDRKLVRFESVTIIHITGKTADAANDEIQTLQSDGAMIRFDRDVEFTKGTSAQPIAGWVEGNVRLRSNQGSPTRDDDVLVRTARLDYDKVKSLIWSQSRVELETGEGMTVAGVGLEIELAPEQPKEAAVAVGKKKTTDVERLRLLDDVKFHLLVDEDDHVLGSLGGASVAATPGKPVPAATKKSKAPLDVASRGPFLYDMRTMQATFERSVVVEREHSGPVKTRDSLICEKLLLKFVEKADGKAASGAAPNGGSLVSAQQKSSLSTVEAFGAKDGVVVLAESQKLRATGDYLFHDAVKKETRLRSESTMVVLQDNVKIQGRALLLTQKPAAGPNAKPMYEATVDGPNGVFEVTDKEADGPTAPKELVVRFNKSLKATPEANGRSRMVDVDGGVELEVPKQPLLMTSEILHVRLEEAVAAPGAPPSSRMEPTWMKAERSVTVASPELDIAAGQSLTMHVVSDDGRRAFVPAAISDGPVRPVGFVALPHPDEQTTVATFKLPDEGSATPASGSALPDDGPAKKDAGSKAAAPKKKSQSFDLGLGRGKERDPTKPPDKVDLRAESVEVFAVKVDGKTEARRAEAVGNVFIRRDAADGKIEEAVEIKGTKVDFYRTPKGDRMVVHGTLSDGGRPAEIVNKKFHLDRCAQIDLDEGLNLMTVDGAGKLTLVGAALVNATDAPKNARAADKPFVVEWKEKMIFDGLNAHFDGAVKTTQQSQRVEPIEEIVYQNIRCEQMTVYFKDRMAFRGAKTESGRKMEVRKVVCDRDVVALESIFRPPPGREETEADRFRYSGISAPSLTFDNELREVVASGVGSKARFIERTKPTVGPDGRPVPPPMPYIRTDAEFGRMTYRQDEKVVKLYDDVSTIRSPVKDVRGDLNIDNMHADGMSVKGDLIELQERADAEGRKLHDFKAIGTVVLNTREYTGYGDEATYDQARDRFVLRGEPAVMQRVAKPGVETPTSSADAIEYYIKENRTKVIGGQRAPNLDLGGLRGRSNGVPVKGARPKQN